MREDVKLFFIKSVIILVALFNIVYYASGSIFGLGIANIYISLYAEGVAFIFTVIYFFYVNYWRREKKTEYLNKLNQIVNCDIDESFR